MRLPPPHSLPCLQRPNPKMASGADRHCGLQLSIHSRMTWLENKKSLFEYLTYIQIPMNPLTLHVRLSV